MSAPTEPQPQPQQPRPGSNWTAGRVIGLVLSSIAALVGTLILLGGLALIAVHSFARDDDGYYTTDTERLHSDTYAISTDEIDLGADPGGPAPEDLLGVLRVRAESTEGRPVFLGIGRTEAVERYLDGVAHARLTDFGGGRPQYEVETGRAPQRRPGAERFWVARSQGAGEQVVDWDVQTGVWSVAVMNAGAARGISVDASVGVEISWLIWVAVGLLVVGLLLAVVGVTLIIVIGRHAARGEPAAAPG
jgi:hypothetical protein